ncbi:MAG: hypothetical protein HY294_14790 [Candidatus Rokubacteria bacterium]|nr:hypothetical protein [Candidatus Rokubacteria bacterium]MBI3827257.1 hypothetical protein [Candidatus Rokubacteria bacterium]
MSSVSKSKRTQSRDQVRIWLSTVLTPILSALDVEAGFAQRHNWSFRCDSQDFEYLWPTEMMIAAPHRANAQQIFRYYPLLKLKAGAHDRTLAALRDACRTAYEKLLSSERFRNLPGPNDHGLENRKYLAEYVINGLRDLPSHYVFADFWNSTGGEYLRLRSYPFLRPSFHSIETTGESFRAAAAALRKNTKQLLERIADEAGLAPADPTFT